MKYPVLSVVIPCWNSELYLPRCLASLTGLPPELLKAIEVIIVDNNSSDETLRISQKHSPPGSTIISEPDAGQSDALNKGVRAATGTFICWLNSDDEFTKKGLAKAVSYLTTATGEWYTTGMIWIDKNSRVVRCSPPLPQWAWLRRLGTTGVGGPSSFVRRTVLKVAGEFDTRLHYCMDTDMWYRLHRLGATLKNLHIYTWAFRIHDASKTSHIHLGHEMNPAMNAERTCLSERHGFGRSRFAEAALVSGTRLAGLLSGRDAVAFTSTLRWKGKHLDEL